MSRPYGLEHVAMVCGNCNCGCPELVIDHDASEERLVVINDVFGQRVQMSLDQLQVLVASAKSGLLDMLFTGV